MSFFEPLPDPPPQPPELTLRPHRRLRDEVIAGATGPQHGIIGGEISGPVILAHNEIAALWIDRLVTFPTGILMTIFIQIAEPLTGGRSLAPLFPWAVVPEPPLLHDLFLPLPETGEDYLRIGVEFGNGASVATGTWEDDWINLAPAPGPFIQQRGAESSGTKSEAGLWIWPFPPPGPLTVHAAWPGLGMDEISVSFSGDDIAAARAKVITLWPLAAAD